MPLEQIILEYAVCEQLDSVNMKPLLKEDQFSKYVWGRARFAAVMCRAGG
jgi:hypothetical protein